jgi:cytochrome bd-type quinol oxidase subunit 1
LAARRSSCPAGAGGVALTVGFHIALPAFSIVLASYLAALEILWLFIYSDVSNSIG